MAQGMPPWLQKNNNVPPSPGGKRPQESAGTSKLAALKRRSKMLKSNAEKDYRAKNAR